MQAAEAVGRERGLVGKRADTYQRNVETIVWSSLWGFDSAR